MPQRRSLCLILILSVFLLAVSPVPAGHGPFSAAYGPATKFQALQTLLLLLFLIAAGITFGMCSGLSQLVAPVDQSRAEALQKRPPDSSTTDLALRC